MTYSPPLSGDRSSVAAVPASTPPTSTRRMLVRPPTLDVVAGVERFRCLDLACVLSRSACADRWRAATHPPPRPGLRHERSEDGPCRGCPVGKIHAGEKRERPLASAPLRRPLHIAPPPAPVEAPPAVVPERRRPTTPPPGCAGAPPSPERSEQRVTARAVAETSPVGVAPDSPPGQAASAGQRPTSVGQEEREAAMGAKARRAKRAPTANDASAVGIGGSQALTHEGTTDTIAGWARRLDLTDAAIRARLKKGLSVAEALAPRLVAKRGEGRRVGRQALATAPSLQAVARRVERGVHPAVALLEACGYRVRQLPAPAGVVLLLEGAPAA